MRYSLPVAPTANSTLVWDAENRLISVTVSNTTTTYGYDHQSRRIRKTTGAAVTRFVYDGWNMITEYSGTTLKRSYTWGMDLSGSMQGAGGVGGLLSIHEASGNGSVKAGQTLYPTYDGNGNITRILDSSSNVVCSYGYDPFGNFENPTGNDADSSGYATEQPFGFSTKYRDTETGLYYYGYRYYDPVTGRWPSRDPIQEGGGLNLYGFINNDGVNNWDYLGLIPPSDFESSTSKTSHDAHKAVQDAASKAMLEARKEFEKKKKEGVEKKKVFKETSPREYGGKVCRHCENVDGKMVYTYYTTIIAGKWGSEAGKYHRDKDGKPAGGVVEPEEAPDCNKGDKKIALWHTHPGGKRGDGGYGQGPWFSKGDRTVADGYIGTDRNTGKKRHFNNKNNPDGVPLFMTRSVASGSNEFETYSYQNGKYYQYESK